MRYVLLRDDDTNALTPVDCLERLYRPFLQRGLPVNLAVIPNVALGTKQSNGLPEGYLWGTSGGNGPAGMTQNGSTGKQTLPIGENPDLIDYLRGNDAFHVVQHGYQHDWLEFDSEDVKDIDSRIECGTELLLEAGFIRPRAFVAPYDRFSSVSLRAAAKRFPVVSSGWYELRRIPVAWWPRYLVKKLSRAPHWRVDGSALLSHPGCLLSAQRPRAGMLQAVKQAVHARQVTVLVTHWWEYFPDGRPDEEFILQLHRTAGYLANDPEVQTITFAQLSEMKQALN